jgi:acylphosphatase
MQHAQEPVWITKTITLHGNVQEKGFRGKLVKISKKYVLEGLIFNDQDILDIVKSVVSGLSTEVIPFIESVKGLMNNLGVEMKVGDAEVPEDSLPSPVARVPNSVYEEVDRFDMALAILQRMEKSLQSLDKLDKLDQLDNLKQLKKLDKLDQLDEINEKLDRIDKNTRPRS